MKERFAFSLQGKDWWKPFIPFWIIYLVYTALNQIISYSMKDDTSKVGLSLFLTFVGLAIFASVCSIFWILFLRIWMPKLQVGDKGFEFHGDVGRIFRMVLGGSLLSIITIGFYYPWFLKKVISYLASETRFGGWTPTFQGKGGKLLGIFLLTLVLPLVLVMIIVGIAVVVAKSGSDAGTGGGSSTAALITSLVTFIFIILIFAPLMYQLYRWAIDYSCAGSRLHWNTRFWPSCFYILGQLCLTIVTIGIYWPAAFLKLYRYFAQRTVIERDGAEIGHLSFEGGIGKGFGLLWGQSLLCIITLGFYIPWGYATMAGWTADNSYYIPKEEPAVSQP